MHFSSSFFSMRVSNVHPGSISMHFLFFLPINYIWSIMFKGFVSLYRKMPPPLHCSFYKLSMKRFSVVLFSMLFMYFFFLLLLYLLFSMIVLQLIFFNIFFSEVLRYFSTLCTSICTQSSPNRSLSPSHLCKYSLSTSAFV